MPLYLIGIGLDNERDVTLRGLDLIQHSDLVYLESYTSEINADIESMERLYNKKIIVADRAQIEDDSDKIIEQAVSKKIALLVIGDPLAATTHFEIFMRARKKGIETRVVHNASVITAVGMTGLQLYKFGRITSIPFASDKWKPASPYIVLGDNLKMGLHTLFLLDLDPKSGKRMRITDAVRYLWGIESKEKQNIFLDDTLCIGCAGLGSEDAVIIAAPSSEIIAHDFEDKPQCLIVPGKLHFLETEAIEMWK